MPPPDTDGGDGSRALAAALDRARTAFEGVDQARREELRQVEGRLHGAVAEVRSDMADLRREVGGVREAVARLEGRIGADQAQLQAVRTDVQAGQREDRAVHQLVGEHSGRLGLIVQIVIGVLLLAAGAVIGLLARSGGGAG